MVGQSGIVSASAASAVAQRYREADSIQTTQRAAAKQQEFAAVLAPEPAVVSSVGMAAAAAALPVRLVPEAAIPARPVARSVLASPALAKRGAAAYEAAAGAVGHAAKPDSEVSTPSYSRVSISC